MKKEIYLVIDTFVCTEGLDPIALLLTTGDTDDGLTSDDVLSDLNKDGSDGTAHEYIAALRYRETYPAAPETTTTCSFFNSETLKAPK